MRFQYRNDIYYHDCHYGDILVCFINRDHCTFTSVHYPYSHITLLSYNDVKFSPSEIMLRIITSLVLL